MTHLCHSPDCNAAVPPRMLFCRKHWFAIPQKIRDAIWREYREGQEITKTPSLRYLAVQRFACAYSVFKPNSEEAARKALPYLVAAVAYQQEAVEQGFGDPLENFAPLPIPTPKKSGLRVVRRKK